MSKTMQRLMEDSAKVTNTSKFNTLKEKVFRDILNQVADETAAGIIQWRRTDMGLGGDEYVVATRLFVPTSANTSRLELNATLSRGEHTGVALALNLASSDSAEDRILLTGTQNTCLYALARTVFGG